MAGILAFIVLAFCVFLDSLNKYFSRYKALKKVEFSTLKISTRDIKFLKSTTNGIVYHKEEEKKPQ